MRALPGAVAVLALSACGTADLYAADDPGRAVPSKRLQARGNPQMVFFLMGPQSRTKPPATGYGLILVLPGGDGSADFQPFVRRIYAHAVPDDCLAVQLVAPKWSDKPDIVWPTRADKVAGMKFSTEDFVEAVIAETGARHSLDRRRIVTLSWSSSGPAAYAVSMAPGRTVTGSFVAMSVFKPAQCDLTRAKGHVYFIYHSPADQLCPFRMARVATRTLAEKGATTRLAEYAGGHGWRGPLYDDIRTGLTWIMDATVAQASTRPASAAASAPAVRPARRPEHAAD